LTSEVSLRLISTEMSNVKHKQQTSAYLLSEIKAKYPESKRKSANKALVDVVVGEIKDGLAENTLIQMFSLLNKIIPVASPGSASQQSMMKDIRKQVIITFGRDSTAHKKSLTLMRFDQQKWKKGRVKYQKQVASKNANKMRMKDKDIYTIMDNVLFSKEQDYASLAVGVQLACGSRIIEILSLGKFTAIKDKPNWVKQVGVAKQDEKDTRARQSVEKPILHYSVDVFLNMIDSIRRQLKPKLEKIRTGALTHYKLSQGENPKVNRRVKSAFSEVKSTSKITSHVLRKIYGNLSYNTYADKAKTSEPAWLSEVLGHLSGSIGVALSYSVVNVDIPELKNQEIAEAKASDLGARQDLHEKAINDLNEKLENMNVSINEAAVDEDKNVHVEETKVSIPTNIRLRDGRVMDRMRASVVAMKANNMVITNKKLRALGYGGRSVAKIMKEITGN